MNGRATPWTQGACASCAIPTAARGANFAEPKNFPRIAVPGYGGEMVESASRAPDRHTGRTAMRHAAVATAFGLVLSIWTSAWAGSPTDQLRGLFAAADHILDPATVAKPLERLSAIRNLVRGAFDFREAARLSLGAEWGERTPKEQDRFVRLFTDLLERSFLSGVTSRINFGDGVKVSYLGESIDGAIAVVRTTIATRSGLEMPFDYRMVDRGGRWAVCDVAIDGVSLAGNYRAQFARVMQSSSYPELLQHIAARVSEATADSAREEPPASSMQVASPAPPVQSAVKEKSPEPPRPLPVAIAVEPPAPPPVTLVRADVETAPVQAARAVEDRPARKNPVPEVPPRESEPTVPKPVPLPSIRPASVTPPRSHTYWVQLGAFRSVDAAGRLASLVRQEEGTDSSRRVTVEAARGPEALTRVRLGPFADRDAATVKARELQGKGYPAFIAEARD